MAKIILMATLLILISKTSSSPITSRSSGRCPDTWVAFDNSCYKLKIEKNKWFNAQKICNSLDSSLVNIGSHEENKFLVTLARNYGQTVWIGLSDYVQGQLVWADTEQNSTYTNWTSTELKQSHGEEDCVTLSGTGSFWNNESCDKAYPAICEKSSDLSRSSGRCPDTWVAFDNSCYKLKIEKNKWFNAQKICKSLDSSLANIGSHEENKFLVTLARNYGQTVWIGLSDYVQGQLVWADTEQNPTYTNWTSTELKQSHGEEDCVTLSGTGSFWNNESCDKAYPAICEKSSDLKIPLIKTTPSHKTGLDDTNLTNNDFWNERK